MGNESERGTNESREARSCSRAILQVDLNGLHDLHDTSASGDYEVEKTNMVEREYSKITKNHQKLITNRISKAPKLAQYTKIGKVSKHFRTVAISDLTQWQFVLTLSGRLSFIILNLFSK